MKKLFAGIIISFTLLTGASSLHAQDTSNLATIDENRILDQVVAVVGSNVILKSEIETQYLQYRMQGFIDGSRQTLKCDILRDLIFQNLLLNQADVDSIVVAESTVEQELDRRFRYFIAQFGSKEKLEEYYGKSVDDFKEEMREVVKNQLIQSNVQSEIVKNVGITPKEVKAYYKEIPYDSLPLINAEYYVAELVREPAITEAQKLEVKERLLTLRGRILKGESFATLAILYSEDPGSAKKGGELGMYGRGELYPEFEDVAFNLKDGEISGIVETEAGFHIIQMIENQKDFVNVRHILIKPKVSPVQIQNTVNYLDSVYQLITNKSYTFDQAVKIFSDNPNRVAGGYLINPKTGSNVFQAEDLDPKVFYTIDKLKVDEVSKPVSFTTDKNREAYRLLKLVKKTEPHKANIDDDYDKIYEIALKKKHEQVLDKWVVDHAKDAYIRVVESYSDCDFYAQIMNKKKNNTMTSFSSDVEALKAFEKKYQILTQEIAKVIIGQDEVVRDVIISIFSKGHALLLGVPGLAKTLLVNTIAQTLGLSYKRIQFTPDLMPSDIIGSEILTENREFKFIQGPIFSNIILADEINRTPPKTQSALLEAMQEQSVTVGRTSYLLQKPFFVLATQNPIEQEGTYPLPEAQLDRFMFNIVLDYPSLTQEIDIVKATTGLSQAQTEIIFSSEEILFYQNLIRKIPVTDNVFEFAVKLVAKTRPQTPLAHAVTNEYLSWGAGPRASQYLIIGAKTHAAIRGKFSPDIEDVKAVAHQILRHRLVRNYKAVAENISMEYIISQLLKD